MDSRAKIIDAAVGCLATLGYEQLSISAVADRARVSRPTVYAYFGTREELVSAAIEHAASAMIERVVQRARKTKTAADFVVQMTMAAREEFLANPALAPMAYPERGSIRFAQGSLSPYAIEMCQEFLRPLVEYEPRLAEDLEEIAETLIRFLISFVLFDSETASSPARLKAYLHRRLVPALGIQA
jgi:AcrR family transcriptional regulator